MGETKRKAKSVRKSEILQNINADEALAILRALAGDKDLKQRIEEVAEEYLAQVNSKEVAADVFMELDSLEVEELWGRSGETVYGYEDPSDMAWEMVEEVMLPFVDQLKKFQKLNMYKQAKHQCLGVLKGIKEYERESKSEFKDWATDAPGDWIGRVLDVWKEWCKDPKEVKKMEKVASD